jgi:hypothetical protein
MEELQQGNENQKPSLPVTEWSVNCALYVDPCTGQADLKFYADSINSNLGGFFLASLVCGNEGEYSKRLTWGGNSTMWYKNIQYSGIASEPHGSHPLYQKDEIQALRDRNPSMVPIISFGGAKNVPLEVNQTDVDLIVAEYESVISNYGFTYLDMNFEASIISNHDALTRHIKAMTQLRKKHPDLRISYTLSAYPCGFNDPDGKWFVNELAKNEIVPDVIQPMLMYMGDPKKDQYDVAMDTLTAVIADVKKTSWGWTESQIKDRLGLCPMFGKSDAVWTLEDQQKLLKLAQDWNVAVMSGWYVNMDASTGFKYSKIAAQYTRKKYPTPPPASR